MQEIKNKLDGMAIVIKKMPDDKLYASITEKDLIEGFKKSMSGWTRKKLDMEGHIKTGKHEVKINLAEGVSSKIT